MIKRYNNLSFLFFIPGIVAQVTGFMLEDKYELPEPMAILTLVLLIGGTLMAITGFGFYAKAKGRNPIWGLVGFVGLPGLL